MLVQDIVRRVRDTAGDSAVLQFTNSTVTDWLNDAIRECVQQNTLLQIRGQALLYKDKREYTLPDDIFKIHSVYVDTAKLELLSLEEYENRNYDLTAVGRPDACCVYAGKLDLYPIPDTEGKLYVNYSAQPKEIRYINDGTNEGYSPNSPQIPLEFHSRLVTYCLAQVALQDDDYAKYQAMMSEFTTGVVDLNHLKNQTEAHYPYQTYIDWEGGSNAGY
jgi:hypothetical protein